MTLVSIENPTAYMATAIYSHDSDSVEYVKSDEFCFYKRIDSYLTLITSVDGETLIGFKIKGFRNMFERMKAPLALSDKMFIPLISAFEAIVTAFGDEVLAEPSHKASYVAAYNLAANDNVQLVIDDRLKLAA